MCRATLFFTSLLVLLLTPAVLCEDAVRRDLYGDPLPAGAAARLGTSRLRHGADITDVCFHPNGRLLAVCDTEHTVRFWDAQSGALLRQSRRRRFVGRRSNQLAFDATGRRYANCVAGVVEIYETSSGKLLQSIDPQVESAHCYAQFFPDGESLLITKPQWSLQCWRLQGDETAVQRWEVFGSYTAPVFSPDGRWIAAIDGRVIRTLSASNGERLREIGLARDGIVALDVSPDGRTIASGTDTGAVQVYESATGAPLWRNEDRHVQSVDCVQFSPLGGTLLTTGDDGLVCFWNADDGRSLRTLHNRRPSRAVWSPDGARIATYSRLAEGLRLRDAVTGADDPPLIGHTQPPFQMQFLADGRVATASRDQTLRVWDPRSGRQLQLHRLPPAPELLNRYWLPALSPDGAKLVSYFKTGRKVDGRYVEAPPRLEASTFPPAETVQSTPAGTMKQRPVFHPNGERFLTLERTTEFVTKRPRLTTQLIERPVENLQAARVILDSQTGKISHMPGMAAVSPDGEKAALTIGESSLLLLDLESGETLHTWSIDGVRIDAVSFSGDGRRIMGQAYKGDRNWGSTSFLLWDLKSGRRLATLPPFHAAEPMPACGALSRDGETLAVGCADGSLALYDVASQKRLVQFRGPDSPVREVQFSPDAKLLVSDSSDGTLLSWSLDPADWPAELASQPFDMETLWTRLGERDAKIAYDAARRMIERPDESLKLLEEKLKSPVTLPPLALLGDSPKLPFYRAQYVLEQIPGETSRRLRSRISRQTYNRPYLARQRFDELGDPLPPGAVFRSGTVRFPIGGKNSPSGGNYALTFLGDGQRMATLRHASTDPDGPKKTPRLMIWSTRTGRLLDSQRLPSQVASAPLQLHATPGGSTFVAVGRAQVTVLDAESGELVRRWNYTEKDSWGKGSALSPDGKTLITGDSGGRLVAWKLDTASQIAETKLPGAVYQLQHATTGRRIVAGANAIRDWQGGVWDYGSNQWISKRKETLKHQGHRIPVVSPDAVTFAAIDDAGDVVLRDFASGKPIRRLAVFGVRYFDPFEKLAFSDDARRLLISDGDTTRVVECDSGLQSFRFNRKRSIHDTMFASRDARYLAVATPARPHVWDVEGKSDLTFGPRGRSAYPTLFVSDDGQSVVVRTSHRYWWYTPDRFERIASLARTWHPLKLSPDWRFCLATDARGRLAVMEVATQTPLTSFRFSEEVRQLELHADNRRLVASYKTRPDIETFDVLTGDLLSRWSLPNSVTPRISPDGRTCLDTADGYIRRAHDAVSGKLLWSLEEPRTSWFPAFLDGGRFVATTDRMTGRSEILDARTGRLHDVVVGNLRTMSPDFAIRAACDAEGCLRVFETASHSPLQQFEAPAKAYIRHLAGGRHVLVGHSSVFDLACIAAPRKDGETAGEQLERLWTDLKGANAHKGYAAAWAYVFAEDEATAYLKSRLEDNIDEEQIRRLIDQLDADEFRVREDATHTLAEIGPPVLPLLDDARRGDRSLEFRRRAEHIKGAIASGVASLKWRRAAFILRRINTPAARELLDRIELARSREKPPSPQP